MSIDKDRTINHVHLNDSDYYQAVYKGKGIHVFASLDVALTFLSGYKDNVVYYDFIKRIRFAA